MLNIQTDGGKRDRSCASGAEKAWSDNFLQKGMEKTVYTLPRVQIKHTFRTYRRSSRKASMLSRLTIQIRMHWPTIFRVSIQCSPSSLIPRTPPALHRRHWSTPVLKLELGDLLQMNGPRMYFSTSQRFKKLKMRKSEWQWYRMVCRQGWCAQIPPAGE